MSLSFERLKAKCLSDPTKLLSQGHFLSCAGLAVGTVWRQKEGSPGPFLYLPLYRSQAGKTPYHLDHLVRLIKKEHLLSICCYWIFLSSSWCPHGDMATLPNGAACLRVDKYFV